MLSVGRIFIGTEQRTMGMRRRRYRRPDPKVNIPGLISHKPRLEIAYKPAEVTVIVRQTHPDRTETAMAISHRDASRHAPAIPSQPQVLHRSTPQAFGASVKTPIGRGRPEIQLGIITTDELGIIALGMRGRDDATAVAIKTPSLASTPITRSRLEMTAVGASVGAQEGLGGMVLGGIGGYLLHRGMEAAIEALFK